MCSSRSSIYTVPWRSRPEQLPQRRRSRRTKIPSISEQSLCFRLCSQAPQIPFAHASLCIITLFVLCTTLKQSDSFPFILFPIAPVGFGFDFSRWSLNIHLDLSAPRGAGHSCVRPRVSMSHLRLPPRVQGRTGRVTAPGALGISCERTRSALLGMCLTSSDGFNTSGGRKASVEFLRVSEKKCWEPSVLLQPMSPHENSWRSP